MSTARLPGLDLGETGRTGDSSLRSSLGTASGVLGSALLALCLYAAFAHGAVEPAAFERIQIAVTVVCVVAVSGWLWNRTLVLRAPALGWVGLALLTAFAVWCALTLSWSVAPDPTWAESNRAVTYALVVALAIALGASHAHALELVAAGFLAVCLAVTAYALGQKLLPGLHLAGLVHLNQTGQLPRLQEPFGYWNALALFVAFGVPLALAGALDASRSEGVRVAAEVAIVPMLVTLAFTYSRGGVLALVCGLAVGIAVSGAGLRWLMWLALAGLAAAPAAVLGLLSHSLTAMNVGLGSRELAGVELAGVLAASMTLLAIAARRLIGRERATVVSASAVRRIRHRLVGGVTALVLAALLAVTFSSRGLTGTVSHAWSSFTTTKAVAVYDPGRLLSADSENRWVWWKEAADAIAARPIAGWGAGSFGVVHLLYRRNTLSVQQPHSVPLQFLAETGVIGALLGLGGIVLLLICALRAVRRLPSGRERLLATGLLAASAAYAVHSLYDWDWDIPGVTLPALLFLGVLAGRAGTRPPKANPAPLARPMLRAVLLALSVFGLAAFAVSVIVPRVAAAKAEQALVSASTASRAQLRPALAGALLASRLDPLSDAGLLAAATIEIHIGNAEQSRRDLFAALGRQPTDGEAWQRLAAEDLALGDTPDALVAARRARALDPYGASARALARQVELLVAREPS
jgi:O-Antigen ligase